MVDRAVAVVIRADRVLVVDRYRDGKSYAVLPGGGIEAGEGPGVAVLRELAEETGLEGSIEQPLWVRHDGGRRATYFRVRADHGTPVLGGPERDRATRDDRYALRWVGADQLRQLDLRPPEVRPLLLELLAEQASG